MRSKNQTNNNLVKKVLAEAPSAEMAGELVSRLRFDDSQKATTQNWKWLTDYD